MMSETGLATKPVRGKVVLSISITHSTFEEWFMWQLEPRALGHLPELSSQGYSRGRNSAAPFPKGTHSARWILDGWLKSSDTLCFAFLSAIVISCHYARFPSKRSYTGLQKHLPSCSLLAVPPPWASEAAASKVVLGCSAHLKPRVPSKGRMRAGTPAERLGKVQPCCFMSTFLPLCLSQGLQQKILFCSYQFKQEQWIPQARKNVTRCQQSQPGRWCMVYRLQLK